MQRKFLISLILVFAAVLLMACGNSDRAVRKTVEDAATAVEDGLNQRNLAAVEPFFATEAEGANKAGLEETWGALRRFTDSLTSSERIQFHSFDVQSVSVHESGSLAKATYRLHLSLLRGSQVIYGFVAIQNLALIKTARGWRISGGDQAQLSEITGSWPPPGASSGADAPSAQTPPVTISTQTVASTNTQAVTTTASTPGIEATQPMSMPTNVALPTLTPVTMEMGGSLMQDEPVAAKGVPPATANEGGQLLPYQLDGDVKVFALEAKPVLWKINAETQVTAWTYNGTVPGPLIRVTEGDPVRVIFKNNLVKPTTIHWHGVPVPNNMDGVGQPIKAGETFTYEFVAKPAGTFMYHSHYDTDTQINIGLFGAFIIEPKNWAEVKPDQDVTLILNEWRVLNGVTYPAMPDMGEPNYFTANGKTYPDIPSINVKRGERVRVRFIGAGQFEHPMHLHGMPFKIVATDGYPVPEVAQLTKDTIPVHPGERFDIEFIADNPGQWAFHCHIVHHVTNNDVEPGGLLFIVNVS